MDLKFKCPRCGYDRLASIEENAVVISEIILKEILNIEAVKLIQMGQSIILNVVSVGW